MIFSTGTLELRLAQRRWHGLPVVGRTDGRAGGGNAPRLRLLLTPPPRRRRLLRSLVSWSDARTNLGQCIQTTLGIWTYLYQLDVGAE